MSTRPSCDGLAQGGGEHADADLGDRSVGPVALGRDDDEFGGVPVGREGVFDDTGLGRRQQAAPGADPDHCTVTFGQALLGLVEIGSSTKGNSPAATASTACWSSSKSSRSASA